MSHLFDYMCMHLPFIPWSIAGVPSSQALQGFLITAPPSVCVPTVIGALTVWIQTQKKTKNRRGWRNVARYVHDSNSIIDARSASPIAPDLVAALSDEGLQSLTSSPSPYNQKYTMRSNIFVLDRIVSKD